MTELRRRGVPDGRFSGMPRSDGWPIGGCSEGLRPPLLQGNNNELAPISPFSAQNRLENICESSSLLDDPQNSLRDGTGNRVVLNREYDPR